MLNKMSRPVVAFFFESSRFSEFFEFRKKKSRKNLGSFARNQTSPAGGIFAKKT